MDNLQTLLKEMTIIEEVNENLKKEVEIEREKNTVTVEQLQTSAKIIEQLEYKIDRQEKQLKQLQQQQPTVRGVIITSYITIYYYTLYLITIVIFILRVVCLFNRLFHLSTRKKSPN